MNMKKRYMEMLHSRHATRAFDTERSIEKDDLEYILEAGRLSPSSYGIEPWNFLVIKSKKIQQKLQGVCFNQEQISMASLVIVVLARKDLRLKDGYVEKLLRRDGDAYYNNTLKKMYNAYLTSMDDEAIIDYADKQCYLAAMNLMNAGALLGIDSCPMGGFEADKIIQQFKIESLKYTVSLVIPFGYKSGTISKKNRRDFDDVVQYIK